MGLGPGVPPASSMTSLVILVCVGLGKVIIPPIGTIWFMMVVQESPVMLASTEILMGMRYTVTGIVKYTAVSLTRLKKSNMRKSLHPVPVLTAGAQTEASSSSTLPGRWLTSMAVLAVTPQS